MNTPPRNAFIPRTEDAGEAEKTLRLIASLPAPEGLEDRMNAGLQEFSRYRPHAALANVDAAARWLDEQHDDAQCRRRRHRVCSGWRWLGRLLARPTRAVTQSDCHAAGLCSRRISERRSHAHPANTRPSGAEAPIECGNETGDCTCDQLAEANIVASHPLQPTKPCLGPWRHPVTSIPRGTKVSYTFLVKACSNMPSSANATAPINAGIQPAT